MRTVTAQVMEFPSSERLVASRERMGKRYESSLVMFGAFSGLRSVKIVALHVE
jgi:hypothetical protein